MKSIVFLVTVFLSMSTYGQELIWTKTITAGVNSSQSFSVKMDDSGNTITLGKYENTEDFDPGAGVINLPSSENMFIQKLDPQGNLLWVIPFTQSTFIGYGDPISIDASGNIYYITTFADTIDIDPGVGISNLISPAGINSIGIVKLSPNGDLIWGKMINGLGYSIEVKGNDLWLLGGYGDLSTVDFDPGAGVYTLPSSYLNALLKLDTDGNFVWVTTYQSSLPIALTADNLGNALVFGSFSGEMDFDLGPGATIIGTPNSSESSYYVLKIDGAGNYIWVKSIEPHSEGLSSNYNVGKLITDNDANIYVQSDYSEIMDFDPDPVAEVLITPFGNGYADMFIEKLDPNGDFQWVNTYVKASSLYNNIATDGTNVFTVGSFVDTLVSVTQGLASLTTPSEGGYDIFLQKINPAGQQIWTGFISGTENEEGFGISAMSNGDIAVTGYFQGITDFDVSANEQLLNTSSSGLPGDIFIARYNSNYCSNMLLTLDSIHEVSCSVSGELFTSVIDGFPPYSFVWDNDPLLDSNVLTITESGQHSLVVIDLNNCLREVSVAVTGPTELAQTELNSSVILSPFRPGFAAPVWLDAFNNSCVPVSGQLTLIHDSLIDFSGSTPAPTSQNGDTLIWDFTDITYDSAHLTPQIVFNTSVQAVIGDTINLVVIMTPISGDADTTNNVKYYNLPVVNGYDPNIKSVYPVGKCDVGYIKQDQLLTYTVQFQNTGNSEAINIAVIDSLDTDLDMNTVRIVGKSHPMWTEVLPGNVLKFHFDNINLPDSTNNEPESHGYVIFEAKPVSTTLTHNTEIANMVDIYFDFNPPIRTNEVSNLVFQNGDLADYSCFAVIKETSVAELMVFPNPSNNQITIRTNQGFKDETILITDLQGKIVLRKEHINGLETMIDVSGLSKGVYLIRNLTNTLPVNRLIKN